VSVTDPKFSEYHNVTRPVLDYQQFAECAFSVVGPSVCNSLPADLQLETDSAVFKCKLKSYLFRSALIQ